MKKESYVSTKESKREAKKVLAYMDGGPAPKGWTVTYHFPSKEIKRIRTEILHLSQSGFAKLLKKETVTIASWEAGRRLPDQTTTMLIWLLSRHRQLRLWMEDLSLDQGLDMKKAPKPIHLRKRIDMSPAAMERTINAK